MATTSDARFAERQAALPALTVEAKARALEFEAARKLPADFADKLNAAACSGCWCWPNPAGSARRCRNGCRRDPLSFRV